jgi:FkbM family methyltransferase
MLGGLRQEVRAFTERSVKYSIGKAVERLPGVVQVQVFKNLARLLSINSVVVRGENGVFEGSATDFVLGSYMRLGAWDRRTIEILCRVLERGGTYCDIGANIGLTVVPIATLGGVECHAFEPAPENLAYLHRNLQANNVADRVQVHECALYASDGQLELELSADNKGDHRIRAGAVRDARRPTVTVPTRRLDSLLDAERCKRPIAVKIDTQGAEVGVWAGGANFLRRADLVIFEFWPHGLEQMESSADQLFAIFRHFSHGAIIPRDDADLTIRPIEEVIAELAGRSALMSGAAGHFYEDVLVTNSATL